MWVIVTGGENGIGRAIIEAFAMENAKVIIIGIDESAGEKTAQELNGEVTFIKTDVKNLEEVEKLLGKVEKIYGLTDILINEVILSWKNRDSKAAILVFFRKIEHFYLRSLLLCLDISVSSNNF